MDRLIYPVLYLMSCAFIFGLFFRSAKEHKAEDALWWVAVIWPLAFCLLLAYVIGYAVAYPFNKRT